MTGKLVLTLLVAIAVGLFAIVVFPLLLVAAVLVFVIGMLKRWRESEFEVDEFD